MRDSLKKSFGHSPAKNFESYPAGSIVLCNACSLPIFRLENAITLGDGAGRMAQEFKPVTPLDMVSLATRMDIDAGVAAAVRQMTPDELKQHCAKLHEVRSGDPMVCPVCNQCFVQVVAVEKHEVLDKAYTVELLVVPPEGKTTRLGGRKVGGSDWLN